MSLTGHDTREHVFPPGCCEITKICPIFGLRLEGIRAKLQLSGNRRLELARTLCMRVKRCAGDTTGPRLGTSPPAHHTTNGPYPLGQLRLHRLEEGIGGDLGRDELEATPLAVLLLLDEREHVGVALREGLERPGEHRVGHDSSSEDETMPTSFPGFMKQRYFAQQLVLLGATTL